MVGTAFPESKGRKGLLAAGLAQQGRWSIILLRWRSKMAVGKLSLFGKMRQPPRPVGLGRNKVAVRNPRSQHQCPHAGSVDDDRRGCESINRRKFSVSCVASTMMTTVRCLISHELPSTQSWLPVKVLATFLRVGVPPFCRHEKCPLDHRNKYLNMGPDDGGYAVFCVKVRVVLFQPLDFPWPPVTFA